MPAVEEVPNSPPKPQLRKVKGCQIFKEGTYRGITYTSKDLDQMVANFDRFAELKPPVVLGHSEDQRILKESGYPSAGQVSKVWRDGPYLVADFVDVVPKVADAIDHRAYRRVSIEAYKDYKGGGHTLRRVSLLGGQLPEVKDLEDIPLTTYQETEFFCEQVEAVELTPVDSPVDDTRNITVLTNEVTMPVATKRAKAVRFSEQARAIIKKFADGEPNMPDQAAPAPAGITRDQMIAVLKEAGYDPAALEKADDMLLAEMIRVWKAKSGAEMADAAPQQQITQPQMGVSMSNNPSPPAPPATPPIADGGAVMNQTPAPAASLNNPLPSNHPQQVTIKYADDPDFQKAVKAALDAALKPIAETLNSTRGTVDKFQESQHKLGVDARLDLLVKQGKVLPAEVTGPNGKGGLREQLYRANGVAKFDDGETELEKQFALLEARPRLLKFAEQIKGEKGTTTGGQGDAELEAVERFSEDPETVRILQVRGEKPADYVKSFKELKAKMPALTATEYGVPANYAS